MRGLIFTMRNIILSLSFIFLIACEKDPSRTPMRSDEDVRTTVDSITVRIDKSLQAGNHEAYIQDYIKLLDYVQQLPAGSLPRVKATMSLLHYANKMGLCIQGIELIDATLADIEDDTSKVMFPWKDGLYAARAGCYYELHQYDKARESFAKELYYKDLQFPGMEHISTLNNIGMTFLEEEIIDSAMYYFRKVESILNAPKSAPLLGEPKNDELFAGSVKDNIATILFQQGQFPEAEILYQENFSMYSKYALQHHQFRLVNAGIQLARVRLQLQKKAAAENTIHTLDSLFNVLNYSGKREHELDFYQIQAQYYQFTGEEHNAIQFQQAYMTLADSLYTAQLERTKLISEELLQYNARQFKQELAHEKREALHQRQNARTRFLILMLIIFFSIAGGLFLTISLRQRLRLVRKQSELNETERKLAEAHAKTVEQEKIILDAALQHKTKDISTLALNARIKKEWAEKLDSLLTQAEQSRGHMRSLALRKLREEIRSHIHADHRIQKMHENIETLNAEFFDHLNARNPDLSKTEVRLVSFLKLRLSNDEIAMIQGISTKSVIMSRYRLKKKLSLPETADLDAFCQEL